MKSQTESKAIDHDHWLELSLLPVALFLVGLAAGAMALVQAAT